jgi:hypothetical protein
MKHSPSREAAQPVLQEKVCVEALSMRFFDVDRGGRVSKKEKSYRDEGKRQFAPNPPPKSPQGTPKV